jgi:hypothetical protein
MKQLCRGKVECADANEGPTEHLRSDSCYFGTSHTFIRFGGASHYCRLCITRCIARIQNLQSPKYEQLCNTIRGQ